MTKEQLREKWGTYTDTDKLVNDVCALLTEYSHRNTEHGVCVMLDKYFTNKEPLIQLLKEIDGFGSDLRLVVGKEFDRMTDRNTVYCKIALLRNNIHSKRFFLKTTDNNGKTFSDYFKTGISRFDVSKLSTYGFTKNLYKISEAFRVFDDDGFTRESRDNEHKFNAATSIFDDITASVLSETKAKKLCEKLDSKKFASGLKTARAFNRVCEMLGVTSYEEYNKWFAEYSNLVSGGTRDLDFVISLNPYDYLTMSFGKSWASCHTIDKRNRRGMANSYSGQYCGGTLSYMLDKSSIITYVIDKGGDPQTCGKIYRNMFHYENKLLVQGRVYPQGNDGATDLYDKFRGYMQEALNKALKIENNTWAVIKEGDCCAYTSSNGAHYRDYNMSSSSCNVSRLDGDITSAYVHIGHNGICPYCGESFTSNSYLSHGSCEITE